MFGLMLNLDLAKLKAGQSEEEAPEEAASGAGDPETPSASGTPRSPKARGTSSRSKQA